MEVVKREARRVHGEQLKAKVLAACSAPGASVARVALEHGLNANLVHRWRRIAEGREQARGREAQADKARFVALPIAPLAESLSMPTPEIRMELRRSGTVVSVSWPVSAAAQSAAWLREVLR